MDWNNIKYFKPSEFDSPDEPGSGAENMDMELVEGLDFIRSFTGKPMRVNSGYRSPEHNAKVGGSSRSQHPLGRAADVHCPTNELRGDMIAAAIMSGKINRIIVYSNFLHFDTKRGVKKLQILWGKY